MTAFEIDDLKRRAEAGDEHALMALAHRFDQAGDHGAALDILQDASHRGVAQARYVLGARLLVGRAAPFMPKEGAQLVAAAAYDGQIEAQRMMAVLAAMSGGWTEALLHLQQAANKGDANAQAQLSLIGAPDQFDIDFWTQPSDVDWRIPVPRIGVIENFIPPAVCQWLIERARPRMEAARIRDPQGGVRKDAYRTNSVMGFSLLDTDFVLQLVQARIAATIAMPANCQEPTNILHYAPGEAYRPHFDFVDPNAAAHEQELKVAGQRTTTFLIYLNDDFDGGETEFPRLDWRYRGKPGDALVFHNIGPDGSPDRNTLHAGLPPTRGEKWLLSKWVRERPVPLV